MWLSWLGSEFQNQILKSNVQSLPGYRIVAVVADLMAKPNMCNSDTRGEQSWGPYWHWPSCCPERQRSRHSLGCCTVASSTYGHKPGGMFPNVAHACTIWWPADDQLNVVLLQSPVKDQWHRLDWVSSSTEAKKAIQAFLTSAWNVSSRNMEVVDTYFEVDCKLIYCILI